jgi:hypothetical protein
MVSRWPTATFKNPTGLVGYETGLGSVRLAHVIREHLGDRGVASMSATSPSPSASPRSGPVPTPMVCLRNVVVRMLSWEGRVNLAAGVHHHHHHHHHHARDSARPSVPRDQLSMNRTCRETPRLLAFAHTSDVSLSGSTANLSGWLRKPRMPYQLAFYRSGSELPL